MIRTSHYMSGESQCQQSDGTNLLQQEPIYISNQPMSISGQESRGALGPVEAPYHRGKRAANKELVDVIVQYERKDKSSV